MNDNIIDQARMFVREQLSGEKSGHDWWHISRVAGLARTIARQEGADPYVCELAALFHDLADEKLVASKEEGMRRIAGWLSEHGIAAHRLAAVTEIIATMSFRGGHGSPMRTLEGQVVQDADRLDAIGAIGIARTFVYAGHKGDIIHDPELRPRGSMTEAEYRKGRSTAINHFHEKLLKLKDLMNTPSGRKLAQDRHAFMVDYLRQFDSEWNAGRGAL